MTDGTFVPAFGRGVKLQFDAERRRWVLPVADNRYQPNEIAVEVLKLVSGTRSIDTIVDLLVLRYDAPRARIAGDVIAILDDLAARGAVRLREQASWKLALQMFLPWLRLRFGRRPHV